MTDLLIAKLRRRVSDPRTSTDQAHRFPQVAAAPLDEESIFEAERVLGLRLPPLLREIYRRVSAGSFGPGYGLLRLLPDPMSSRAESAIGLYTTFCSTDPEDPVWSWPVQLLPFCDWGCAIRSCIDCSTADGAVVTFAPNERGPSEPMSRAFAVTHPSLHAWFSDWIGGVKIWELMFERDPSRARTIMNPFTKQPSSFVPTRLRRPKDAG
jgi:hypothetical protein